MCRVTKQGGPGSRCDDTPIDLQNAAQECEVHIGRRDASGPDPIPGGGRVVSDRVSQLELETLVPGVDHFDTSRHLARGIEDIGSGDTWAGEILANDEHQLWLATRVDEIPEAHR